MDIPSGNKRTRDEFEDESVSHDVDFGSKKQHVDPATELISNVCKDIRRIGENANLANQIDDISYISNPIVAEFEKIDKLRTSILDTLYAITIEQPQKITSLSVLVLICNSKNFLVSKYVIEYIHSKAQGLLDSVGEMSTDENDAQKGTASVEDAGPFNNIKSILKFLACLSPIVENFAVVNLFRQFLNLAVELQEEQEGRCGIAEEIFYNTLISLPYLICNDHSSEMRDHCNELVELASKFTIKGNDSPCNLIQPFDSKLDNFEIPYKPKRMIDLIYPSILKLQGEDKSWSNLHNKLFLNFKEFVDPIIENALKNNTISNELIKHSLPQLSLPSKEQLVTFKPQGLIDLLWTKNTRFLFQVYNTTTPFETVPSLESYHGLLFRDLAFDILTNLSFNKNEASIQLSILDLYFAKNLFAPPGSSIDQLSLVHNDNVSGENNPPLSTWKIEDIAVESILTMIFQLPLPLHHEIYYYTVLIVCCRESPESIAPVFGRAIRYFYNNLEMMDYELKIRYLDWMTIQISNFEFSWKWDEWVSDSKKFRNLRYHPKRNFIKNLIAKEIRLSNKNRIRESFVTVNPDPNAAESLILLDEFYQYLNISLFPNESKYIISYDCELFGNNDEYKEILAKLEYERKEKISTSNTILPQEELVYVFSNSGLPLNEISKTVYDFIIASWKPNDEFKNLYDQILESVSEHPDINSDKFLINVIFQTYAYIGSRSIYSVVSLFERDIVKLQFLSGVEINEERYLGTDFKFTKLELSETQIANRQRWIVDSIFRIWIRQPQVAFLILEYLIEFGILQPQYLIEKALDVNYNLIVDNISCMESINRVLLNQIKKEGSDKLILNLFDSIVKNINHTLNSLREAEVDNPLKIVTEFSEEEIENEDVMERIDNQWLLFEYKGLLKSYLRKFGEFNANYKDPIKAIFDELSDTTLKDDVLNWLDEI